MERPGSLVIGVAEVVNIQFGCILSIIFHPTGGCTPHETRSQHQHRFFQAEQVG